MRVTAEALGVSAARDACLDVDGIVVQGNLPHIRLHALPSGRAGAHVDVAVAWPADLHRVGDQVRTACSHALTEASIRVAYVEVTLHPTASPKNG